MKWTVFYSFWRCCVCSVFAGISLSMGRKLWPVTPALKILQPQTHWGTVFHSKSNVVDLGLNPQNASREALSFYCIGLCACAFVQALYFLHKSLCVVLGPTFIECCCRKTLIWIIFQRLLIFYLFRAIEYFPPWNLCSTFCICEILQQKYSCCMCKRGNGNSNHSTVTGWYDHLCCRAVVIKYECFFWDWRSNRTDYFIQQTLNIRERLALLKNPFFLLCE